MYRSYYNILVCCITIRYCGIIKYYNHSGFIAHVLDEDELMAGNDYYDIYLQ